MDRGFSIHDDVFERSEMVRILESLERAELVRTKAGARHVLALPSVRTLASDPTLLNIARHYVGASAFAYRATLFDKSPSSNWLVAWHQDTALPVRDRVDRPDWGPWSTKHGVLHAIAPASALRRVVALRVHLDDSTVDNGPLRVLPGSHEDGVLNQERLRAAARTIGPVDCIAAAGGVVAMRPLIVHASSKAENTRPRRVLHVEYVADVQLGGGVEIAIG